jgi:integrative and conjugative element protein (TIGR02256 family)
MIRVWSRDPDVGAVAMHEVPVAGERSVVVGTLSVFIDAGLEDKLRSLRQKGLPEETGGILLGYHDFNVNAVVLVDALPAPVDSLRSTAFFERGIQGLATAVNNATRRTAGIVGYVGEWHSHPEGYSAAPSGQDLFQLVYLALGMADDGLPAVSVIVSETDVQIIGGVVKHVTVNEHVP